MKPLHAGFFPEGLALSLADTLREFHQTKHDDLLALWAGTRQYMKTCQYHPMTLRSPESLTILP